MRRFQEGDKDAFETLYRRYKNPIFSFFLRQYTGKDKALELTQEVFLKVVRNAQSFRHGSKFATWIFAVARNQGIDALRRAGHRKTTSLDQAASENTSPLGEKIAGDSPSPERSSARSRLQGDILGAISSLPPDQREVFLLREYHGLAFKDIAEVVDAKEGTVKSRMRYALEALRAELEGWSD